LNSIEAIVFGRIRGFKTNSDNVNESDWIKLFKDAKTKYEQILDDRIRIQSQDSTWFLLAEFIDALPSAEQIPDIQSRNLSTSIRNRSCASSGSSSIETMPIAETHLPVGKLIK
jgi:hypothetical protein